MAFDRNFRHQEPLNLNNLPLPIGEKTKEIALSSLEGGKVFLSEPFAPFVGVARFGPFVQGDIDVIVDVVEGLFTTNVTVVISPPSQKGVELSQQLPRRLSIVGFDDASYLEQTSLDRRFGGFDNQLALVFA